MKPKRMISTRLAMKTYAHVSGGQKELPHYVNKQIADRDNRSAVDLAFKARKATGGLYANDDSSASGPLKT
jgi:hypothetical protein